MGALVFSAGELRRMVTRSILEIRQGKQFTSSNPTLTTRRSDHQCGQIQVLPLRSAPAIVRTSGVDRAKRCHCLRNHPHGIQTTTSQLFRQLA